MAVLLLVDTFPLRLGLALLLPFVRLVLPLLAVEGRARLRQRLLLPLLLAALPLANLRVREGPALSALPVGARALSLTSCITRNLGFIMIFSCSSPEPASVMNSSKSSSPLPSASALFMTSRTTFFCGFFPRSFVSASPSSAMSIEPEPSASNSSKMSFKSSGSPDANPPSKPDAMRSASRCARRACRCFSALMRCAISRFRCRSSSTIAALSAAVLRRWNRASSWRRASTISFASRLDAILRGARAAPQVERAALRSVGRG